MFMSSPSTLMNEIVGGWSLSNINSWHTGQAWGTNSNAFVASYSNDAPGILVGQRSAVATKLQKPAGGGVNIFANQANAAASYIGPIGFQIGARNGLRGPNFYNADFGLAKNFPIYRGPGQSKLPGRRIQRTQPSELRLTGYKCL